MTLLLGLRVPFYIGLRALSPSINDPTTWSMCWTSSTACCGRW